MTFSATRIMPQLTIIGTIADSILFFLPILSITKMLMRGAVMKPTPIEAPRVEASSGDIEILEFGSENSSRLGEVHPTTLPMQNEPTEASVTFYGWLRGTNGKIVIGYSQIKVIRYSQA